MLGVTAAHLNDAQDAFSPGVEFADGFAEQRVGRRIF